MGAGGWDITGHVGEGEKAHKGIPKGFFSPFDIGVDSRLLTQLLIHFWFPWDRSFAPAPAALQRPENCSDVASRNSEIQGNL